MKYLFFFKGQPLLLCCVCCKIAIQDFLRGLHKKNKKNLPFHRRIYRRKITRQYFTESCKKITGFCHIHRRIADGFPMAFPTLIPTASPTGCRTHVWHVFVYTITDGITDGSRMSDTCPSARIPTAFPTSYTDDITDGSRMSNMCPSARIPTAFSTEWPTDRKVWRDFWTFLVRILINFRRNYQRKFRRKYCFIYHHPPALSPLLPFSLALLFSSSPFLFSLSLLLSFIFSF